MTRRTRWVGAAAIVLALGCAGYLGVRSWLYRAAMGRAMRDLDRGRYAAAAPQLAEMARRWPGDAEVEYRLGECEQALGNADGALAAWSRVPPGSTRGLDTALARGRLAMERGRFAEAEQALTGVVPVDPGGRKAVDVRQHLIHLFVQEGRFDEAQALLERQWRELVDARPGDALAALRARVAIDLDTTPLTGLSAVLDRAAALAPGDGRVALARANLATREGRFEDARRALDEALQDGPADGPVERARLRWALVAGRDDEVEAAAAALGTGGLSAEERLAMDAWRAARRGDRRGERAAWERLVEAGPARPAVLDRLASLALADGDAPRAAELRRRKAAIDRALNLYRTPTLAGNLADNPRELARLAATLGRRFEAHAFLTMAVRRAPADREARQALAENPDDPSATSSSIPLAAWALVLENLYTHGSREVEPVASEVPRFVDEAGPSGLDFVFRSGETSIHQLPEVMGGGVGLIDVDGDGWLDVYLVQGGAFPPVEGMREEKRRITRIGTNPDRRIGDAGSGPRSNDPRQTREEKPRITRIVTDSDQRIRGAASGRGLSDPRTRQRDSWFIRVDPCDPWSSSSLPFLASVSRTSAVPGAAVPEAGDRLFRNRGDGSFEDITERSGIGRGGGGYGHGVAVGDVDNDGHPDLFLTGWRRYRLLRNRGDGSFEDVTGPAGLGGDRGWPTSAAFADLDGDGDLDLYVCHYVAWDAVHPRLCRSPARAGYTSCDPKVLEPEPDRAFRNDGGRFTDVTAEAGLVESTGRGLGVVAADLDGDGRVDLFVANDGSANFFWRNLGGFRFEEAGLVSGLSANASGGYQAGMGVACGDLDGDGRLDLAVTNFFGESASFYKNLGGGEFAERSAAVGLVAATRSMLGFGVALIDADNDGRLDLLSANGHVNDFRPAVPYAMPAQLLLGRAGGSVVDVSARAGEPFGVPHLGRGLAAGDLDNDGRTDALLVALDAPIIVLHNRSETTGHWLTLALTGTGSNRDAVGAVVTVRHGEARQVAVRFGGGSYLSAGDSRIHFGLGASRSADAVEVRWPSGRVDTFAGLEADRGYGLREGDREAMPLPGFPARAGRR